VYATQTKYLPKIGYISDMSFKDIVRAKYFLNELNTVHSIELSSTFIRNAIADGKNMKYFLPPGVHYYIKSNNLYN